MKRVQGRTAGYQVRHGNVDGLKSSRVKRGGHFNLAVDALLSEDGHAWASRMNRGRLGDGRLREIVGWVKAKSRIVCVANGLELFARARWVIALCLHAVAHLVPGCV